MKTDQIQITTLATDIEQTFRSTFGEQTDMIRLCRDHPKPLYHQDQKPVLFISQDEFVGLFDKKAHHFFIPPDQVYRIGTYCRLRPHQIIALMLKSIWESYLSDMGGLREREDATLDEIMNDTGLIDANYGGFKPHLGKMYGLFSQDSGNPEEAVSYDTFEFIVQDLVTGRQFLYANESLKDLYPEKETTERKYLSRLSEVQRESFLKAREIWLLRTTDLDDMLLLLERKKRLNLAIENKYFEAFGTLERERSEVRYRLEKYTLVLKIAMEKPGLSIREILRLASRQLLEAEAKRSQVRNKIARSLNKMNLLIPEGTRTTASREMKESYIKACKELLRKLYYLLHTDTCPGYEDLSPEKQTEIKDLWLEVMKSTREELFSYSPSMILYSMPDYEHLEAIYIKACQILELDPGEFRVGNRLEFMIRKDAPIETIMEFLDYESEKISLHLAHLELVQNEYTNEDQSQVYRNALTDLSGHTTFLEKEISEMKDQIKELKQKISAETSNIRM